MYRTLDPDKIVATLEQLEARILERFPGAGLGRVCAELKRVAGESRARTEQLAKPNIALRALSGLVILAGVATLIYVARQINVQSANTELFGMLQGIEATVNLLIVVGAAVLFLTTLEGRAKRTSALADLYQLRSIVHVIDMHQLTKDPGAALHPADDTASSPRRIRNAQELVRYLDYCSEMLSLSSKVAALYAQSTTDAQVIDAVNELERLTTNLSQKIWQKINIIERTRAPSDTAVAAAATTAAHASATASSSAKAP
ncbi:MAG: hypothetical protein HC868_05805 [Sphingomonadales bacterium]|nr:hypothetical protein [Sphingomonadales bacterium]